MRTCVLIILLALGPQSLLRAQSDIQELNPESYFDFWVGEWELSWTDGQGNPGSGVNRIIKTLDSVVIQENFEALEGRLIGYKGKSFSVYNPQQETWHQAWVDNQGGYIDLKGEMQGNKRIFMTAPRELPQGGSIISRMVFYDIQKDSFTWDWESSRDGGETWTLNWRINYKRNGGS